MTTILHYIADPLCGWCFGAAPLLEASQKVSNLPIKLHLGGLFSAPNNQIVDKAMIRYIMSHHERITQLCGQTPGTAFTNLLNTGNAVLDSTPPIKGILAANRVGSDMLAYYKSVVKAHFIEGRRVAELETLKQVAAECGIDTDEFQDAYENLGTEQLNQHINDSRLLLQSVGGQGFPTFVLEQNDELQIINHQSLYNDPSAWQQILENMLVAETTH